MRRLGGLLAGLLVGTLLLAVPTAPAQGAAAECEQLGADQVRYDAPLLDASLTAGGEACWELPGDADDAYVVGLPQTAEIVRDLVVEDASGTTVCGSTTIGWPLCRLEGSAPFRLRVRTFATPPGGPVTIAARVLRVSVDTGCPAMDAQPFGTQAQLTGSTLTDFRCYSFDLPAGAMPLLSVRGPGYTVGLLLSAAGERVCGFAGETGCAPPGTVEEGTVIVGGLGYRLALYDAGSSAGCGPGLSPTWGSAPVSGRLRDLVQVDCWLVPGAAGEVVVPSTESAEVPGGRLVNGDGEEACVVDTHCRLVGPPPYRMLLGEGRASATNLPADYRAIAPSLAPGSGCPLLTTRPFGQAAADRHRGVGCRQFDVQPGQRLQLGLHDLTDDPAYAGAVVIGPDGRHVDGAAQEPFFTAPAGRYSLVTHQIGADFLTMLHAAGDGSGCSGLPTDLTSVTTQLPLGTAECHTLEGAVPGDRVRPIVLSLAPQSSLDVVLVDALGAPACDGEQPGYCTLVGLPPFRALVERGSAGSHAGPTPYLAAVLDEADPPTCREVAPGSRSGVVVQLSAQRPIDCLTVPSMPDDTTAVHVRRLLGAGGSVLVDLPGSVACAGAGWFSPVRRYSCTASGSPSDSHDVLVVGDGREQIAYVAATSPAVAVVDEPGLTRFLSTTRPRLRGTPVVGRRLRVDPGAWAPRLPDIRFTYRWYVGARAVPGAKGRALALRPAYAGKKVRVQVTARSATMLDGVATTAKVRVRRR